MIPPRILPASADDRDLLEEITGHLERGGLLGYPTETVYGLGARVDREGIRALRELKGREEDKPFLVLIPRVGEVGRMGLEWTEAARDLAEVFWPGPLTLVLQNPGGRQPAGVRGPTGGVAVRVSPEPFVRALMEHWDGPLLSTSANVAGGGPARTARGLASALVGRPGSTRLWIADGGPLPGATPSTLVDCTGERPRVLREGAVGIEDLRGVTPELEGPSTERVRHEMNERNPSMTREHSEAAGPDGSGTDSSEVPFRLLFVCTGNTCRSPIARAIAERALKDRGWRGFEVRSAGVAAQAGSPASGGAVRVASARGLDLGAHRSTSLTPELVEWADLVLTMSPAHLAGVEAMGGKDKAAVITGFVAGEDDAARRGGVRDPIGGDDREYEATFEELQDLLDEILGRLAPLRAP